MRTFIPKIILLTLFRALVSVHSSRTVLSLVIMHSFMVTENRSSLEIGEI